MPCNSVNSFTSSVVRSALAMTAANVEPEAPEPDLPEPSLKQYFLGWGAVFLGLVVLATLLGLLLRFLR